MLYDFHGARLGMTVDQWRSVPVPAFAANSVFVRADAPQPRCLGDEIDGRPIETMLSPTNRISRTRAEEGAKVLVCRHMFWGDTGASAGLWQSAIRITKGYTAQVDYKFLDGRLYEIYVVTNAGALDDVLGSLRAAWSKPDRVVNDKVRNKAGVAVPHTVQTWSNPVAEIRLETPMAVTYDLSLKYVAKSGVAQIRRMDRMKHPDEIDKGESD